MKSITSAREEMLMRAKRNFNFLIFKRELRHSEFVKYCAEKHNVEINQGNLSKSLKEKGKLDILVICLLCDWLDVDMKVILEKELATTEHIIDHFELAKQQNSFVMTNETKEFEKYLGTYYCYFYPTVSGEKELICGKMDVKECYHTKRCNVILKIDTNAKQKDNGKPYIKEYEGRLMLLERKQVCYCIVSNDELGESNIIIFRHVKLNNERYLGGMAAVLTISAGGTNVPTFHRMLISSKEILGENRKLILGNLYLNWSKIMVEKATLEHVLEETVKDKKIREKILSNSEQKEFYVIKERYLRSLNEADISPFSRGMLIARIREVSEAIKYNKISQRLDENIVDILKSL